MSDPSTPFALELTVTASQRACSLSRLVPKLNVSASVSLLVLLVVILFTGLVPQMAIAQIHRAPADTGVITWGHTDFTPYVYPAMCDRAGREFIRYSVRTYEPDTTFEDLIDSIGAPAELSPEDTHLVQRCLERYTPQQVAPAQLWGYIRAALLLGEDEKALAGIERVITEAPDSVLRENAYTTAITTFLTNSPRRLDLLAQYLTRLDGLTSTPSPSSVSMRNVLMSYWRGRYYPDSVRKYATEAIRMLQAMSFQNREQVNAIYPYSTLINIANDEGDLVSQSAWLDSMATTVSDWGSGRGGQMISGLERLIDFRKTLYGKRANPITEGHWFNTDRGEWPVMGKPSLLVLVDHLCVKPECLAQYRTIKQLKTVFGDDLFVALVTQSAGHSIGTPVLDLQAEGDSIVSLFTRVYDMPYAVLLDPRPTSKIPDGRIFRGVGPVAELFSDWRGMNAILTDSQGRVQWMGGLVSPGDRRPMIATIRRLIEAAP